MNINYKISTIILAILLVGVLVFSFGLCHRYDRRDEMGGMHMMGGGKMMRNDGMSMDIQMKNMSASLEGKTGDDLDKSFLEEMIVHHEGAVAMANTLASGTKRPELQKMAQDIITAQAGEIAQMKEWLAQWFSKNQY